MIKTFCKTISLRNRSGIFKWISTSIITFKKIPVGGWHVLRLGNQIELSCYFINKLSTLISYDNFRSYILGIE